MTERKFKLEDFGTQYIQSLSNPINPTLGTKIRAAWLEYEEGKTAESRFIPDMDKFECMVQAYEYEQRTFGEKNLEEFQGLSSKISSAEGKAWLELLQQEHLYILLTIASKPKFCTNEDLKKRHSHRTRHSSPNHRHYRTHHRSLGHNFQPDHEALPNVKI